MKFVNFKQSHIDFYQKILILGHVTFELLYTLCFKHTFKHSHIYILSEKKKQFCDFVYLNYFFTFALNELAHIYSE